MFEVRLGAACFPFENGGVGDVQLESDLFLRPAPRLAEASEVAAEVFACRHRSVWRLQQLGWSHAERIGQSVDVEQGNVAHTTLHATEVAACDSALQRKPFLRPVARLAQLDKPLPENDQRIDSLLGTF